MTALITPEEILAVYTFDFPSFLAGFIASFCIALAIIIVITIIIPIVVRDRSAASTICTGIFKGGFILSLALAVAAGYFHQEFGRAAFADALIQALTTRLPTKLSEPDKSQNVIVTIGGKPFKVPGAVLYDLNIRLFEPRGIKVKLPKLVKDVMVDGKRQND